MEDCGDHPEYSVLNLAKRGWKLGFAQFVDSTKAKNLTHLFVLIDPKNIHGVSGLKILSGIVDIGYFIAIGLVQVSEFPRVPYLKPLNILKNFRYFHQWGLIMRSSIISEVDADSGEDRHVRTSGGALQSM